MTEPAGATPRELKTLLIRFPMAERHLDRLRQRFPDLNVVVATTDDDIRAILPEADAVVGWSVSSDEIAAAPRLKWIQTIGAGVENVIIPEMAARSILLTNNSGVHAPNIAEHLMAMLLAFARRLPFLVRGQLLREWRDESGRSGVFELNGQTLLVVGLGDIGLALAERAKVFGMTVVGVRRRLREIPSVVSEVVTFSDLERVLPSADHVAICLPLTPATHGLFNRDQIRAMRSGSYLYNIGRGQIVDTTALVEALSRVPQLFGRLGGHDLLS